MVAEGDGIGAGIDEFLVDLLRDPKTAGGVLAIDDHEIERPVADHAGQMFRDGGATGPADHVADEKNAQSMYSGNRKPGFPLAQNPAPRRAAGPARPRFAARQNQGRWPRWASLCANAPGCSRSVRRRSRCDDPAGRMPPTAPA